MKTTWGDRAGFAVMAAIATGASLLLGAAFGHAAGELAGLNPYNHCQRGYRQAAPGCCGSCEMYLIPYTQWLAKQRPAPGEPMRAASK